MLSENELKFLEFQFNDCVNEESEDNENYEPPSKKSKPVSATTKEKGKQKKAKNNQEKPKKVSILSQIVKFDVRLVCISQISASPDFKFNGLGFFLV